MQTDDKLTNNRHLLSLDRQALVALMLGLGMIFLAYAASASPGLLSVNSYLDHLDSVVETHHAPSDDKPTRTYTAATSAPTPPSITLAEINTRLRNTPNLAHDQKEFFVTYYGQRPHRGRWLLIDTHRQTLTVLHDNQPIRVYDNIATGRGGLTYFKIRDDEQTVLGTFYINLINSASRYQAFFQFAYPTHAHFDYALEQGLMSSTDYAAAMAHYRQYGVFPQNTILGGHLGIHGLGEADYDTHLRFNWTRGCIALSNEQIESLRKEIEFGTIVVIE